MSQALLTKLAEIGIQIEEQLPTIRKIQSGIYDLESKLPEIEAAGQKVLELEQKLPDLHDKTQKIVELEERIPEINRASESILKLQQNLASVLGPSFIKDVKGPLAHIPIMCTGGITLETAKEYLDAGAHAVGAGSALLRNDLIAASDWAGLTKEAERWLAAVGG
ncbi:hypothetical protein [Brevibacillus invocatus]|uniref:hypothetical protein n=1 Tax=Brevibacillus invocatus TaxID=173959 RepID=UPI00203A57C9|nr:hypothetical protein [Brevibacillus invocatus]MCM3428725.1 hypothetical protein [Brevibacillus invocatus]